MTNAGPMQLVGAAQVHALLVAYPKAVAAAATRTGLRKSARALRAYLVQAAPERTGKLRKAINVKRMRPRDKTSARMKVGLQAIRGDSGSKGGRSKIRYYYKTLEFDSARGPAMHPFFLNTWNSHREEIAQMIVEQTRVAVYSEAAKVHRRTLGLKKTKAK